MIIPTGYILFSVGFILGIVLVTIAMYISERRKH